MTRFIRCVSTVALLVASMVGCSSSTERATGSGESNPSSLADFVSADGYPNWAATEDHLFGFSGIDVERPDVRPRYGYVSLDGGSITDLPLPDTTATVVPLAAVGLADVGVLVAAECEATPTIDMPTCSSSRLSLFTTDFGEPAAWQKLTLPDSLGKVSAGSVALVQPSGESAIVVLTSQGDDGGAVFVVGPSGVQDLGIDPPSARQYCVSDGALFSLRVPVTDDPVTPVGPSLLRSDAQARPVEIELPDVDEAYGAISTRLVCDGTSVFLASSGSSPAESDPIVWQSRDGGPWSRRDDLVPAGASIATQALSSQDTIALNWNLAVGGGAVTTAKADDTGKVHPESSGGILTWHGGGGSLLVVSTADGESDSDGGVNTVEP